MRVIGLDASGWDHVLDFCAALKAALGSCAGHGDSPDAWVDSMIYGGMNDIEAPYVVRIEGTAHCTENVREYIAVLSEVIRQARAEKLERYGKDVDVTFEIHP